MIHVQVHYGQIFRLYRTKMERVTNDDVSHGCLLKKIVRTVTIKKKQLVDTLFIQ